MKKLMLLAAALGSVACVEATSKGSNPDITADTSQSGSLFVAPQQPAPETNSGGGTSLGDTSRVIGEMSQGELSTLCDATVSTVTAALGGKSIGEVGCQLAYLSFSLDDVEAGDIGEVCELVVETCANSDDNFECPFAGEDMSECTATVGEFQACLNAVSSQYKKLADLSCSTVTLEQLREFESFDEPRECRDFERKCPFDDDGEEPQPVDPPRPEPDPRSTNNGNNFPDDGDF